ncbi:protein-export membrane protein SecF [Candidatus Uhrbacteria bacterium RIFCSPHIGHO2_12_FULL_60_25]|uniref:Protein-export membrane protein SecF n=1 Tax=Candidatus Uhrbacteria bacterium RIFCSPHIGHO2_12_FULL_60_25 TaxID=1802399 RepID=A0A1F7ULF6_9BACT|nr:MAG: protein-export membrane protein SecF [Candidatus Uhrbacteria bacterium RIFCSPHIGHO2_02_FULL_60_44]OGL79075.1 MAG: protein-export membrane protein SecF [Candidatus Uhrbacteria bacterium RIFCSPHIGHO2_12_FULL_60_25]
MNIVKLRTVWYAFSGTLIIASIFAVATFGLKQGIDFTGGSLMTLRFEKRPTSLEVERAMTTLDLGSVVIQPVGDNEMNIRTKTLDEKGHGDLLAAVQETFGKAEELRYDSIGPSIGAELRDKSWKALLIVFGSILAYIAYTFRKVSTPVQSWKYGLITVFTAFHDVIIPIGLFAILGKYFNVEIGTPFIAAILTIMGYSINDTIVVLDRVRENLHRMGGDFEHIVSTSLKQTYLRSFNTSITTLFSLVAIYFFGGESIRDFALALIVGIVTGTYSSIFIASPLLVTWHRLTQRR